MSKLSWNRGIALFLTAVLLITASLPAAKAKEKEIWDRMQVLEDILQNAVADNEKK